MSTGGRKPYHKGYRLEHEVCKIAREAGKQVKRSAMSKYPDVEINHQYVSCKARKTGLKWAYDELLEPYPHDYVLFKADRMPILEIKIWKP